MKKILVTGSSGIIGTRLCEKLIEDGYNIVGVDYVKNKWNKEINQATIQVDLRDKKKTLELLPKDIDLIVHLAANARVYELMEDPQLAIDNFNTLFNVLEFARINNINKFVFSSSREAYGNKGKVEYTEDEADINNCESPYAASKIGGEPLVRSYMNCYGINFVLFRFSNVYGMYDETNRVIPIFIKKCQNGEDLEIYGAEKFLDFTHVDDVIQGLAASIDRFDDIKNEVYNVASGQGISILKLGEMIKDKMNTNNSIKIGDNRTGEVVKFVANIDKAKQKLGYEPKISVEEGLDRSIKWYLDNLYK